MTAPLSVRGVRVRYGGLVAVDVDEIDVQRGEIVGIIGANGAGKTTLFDVISGLVTPLAGSVRLDGAEIVGASPSRRGRLGLGRSFQAATLFASLTVVETVQVALERSRRQAGPLAAAIGTRRARRAERSLRSEAECLVDSVGMGDHATTFISELSTGSRRIIDLACVVAHRPRVLLLDEPSSGIAQREVEALGGLLRRIRGDLDCTMVVIEHDIPMLRSLADRFYAMGEGRIIATGAPADVLSDPVVVSSYLGSGTRAVERSGPPAAPPDTRSHSHAPNRSVR